MNELPWHAWSRQAWPLRFARKYGLKPTDLRTSERSPVGRDLIRLLPGTHLVPGFLPLRAPMCCIYSKIDSVDSSGHVVAAK